MDFTVNNILEEGEKTIWQVKPNYKRYIRLSRICVAVCILIAMLLALIIFAVGKSPISESMDTVIILVLIIVISVGWYFSQKWKYKHLSFIFTNKRILYPKTSFKEEYNSIEYSKINDIKLNIGKADKKYGTGGIIITENYNTAPTVFLFMLDNPHEYFRAIEKFIAEPEIAQQSAEQLEKHIAESKAVKTGWAKRYRFEIILITVAIVIVAGLTMWFMSWMLEYEAIPEQVAQAEVVDKRIEENRSDGSTYYYFYVTFKFYDDSEKEIQIMNFPSSSSEKRGNPS